MKVHYDPGRYVCRITGQGLKVTPNGNVELVISFIVLGTPDPNDPERYNALKTQLERRFFRVLNDKTMEFAIEDLRTLGFAGTDFGQLDPSHPKHISFKDLIIDMFCDRSTDLKGEPREDWSIARSAPLVPEGKQVPPDKIRELNYVFGKQLKALAPKSTAKPQAVAAGTSQEVPEEEEPV